MYKKIKNIIIKNENSLANGIKVETFLDNHPKIKKAWLESFPGLEIAIKQMKGIDSIFSFKMKSFQSIKKIMESFKIYVHCFSWNFRYFN